MYAVKHNMKFQAKVKVNYIQVKEYQKWPKTHRNAGEAQNRPFLIIL